MMTTTQQSAFVLFRAAKPISTTPEGIEAAAHRVGEILSETNIAAVLMLMRHFDPQLVIGLARAAVNISNLVREDPIVTRPAKVRETSVMTHDGFTRKPSDIFFHLMRQHCAHQGVQWQTLHLPHAQSRARRANS